SGLAPEARAQQPPPQSPPVEAIKEALRERVPALDPDHPEDLAKALQERAKTLKRLTDGKSDLQSLSDIEQALLLQDWDRQFSVSGGDSSKVDREARQALLKRFLQGVKDEIKAGNEAHDPTARAAVATLVGEF